MLDTRTTYTCETWDLCDDRAPQGSSPVYTTYAQAVNRARRMASAYAASGSDYLVVRVLRRDRSGGTSTERYVYHTL